MGKFNERALRMRKERIDLFGDRSAEVIISRPERPTLSLRELIPSLATDVAKANPTKLCFVPNCANEIQSLNVCIHLSINPKAKPIWLMACPECSKKPDSHLLMIVRRQAQKLFGLSPSRPPELNAAHFAVRAPKLSSATSVLL